MYLYSSFNYNILNIIHIDYISLKYVLVYVLRIALYVIEKYIILFLFCS